MTAALGSAEDVRAAARRVASAVEALVPLPRVTLPLKVPAATRPKRDGASSAGADAVGWLAWPDVFMSNPSLE